MRKKKYYEHEIMAKINIVIQEVIDKTDDSHEGEVVRYALELLQAKLGNHKQGELECKKAD